jgi:hypothetical protein
MMARCKGKNHLLLQNLLEELKLIGSGGRGKRNTKQLGSEFLETPT